MVFKFKNKNTLRNKTSRIATGEIITIKGRREAIDQGSVNNRKCQIIFNQPKTINYTITYIII